MATLERSSVLCKNEPIFTMFLQAFGEAWQKTHRHMLGYYDAGV